MDIAALLGIDYGRQQIQHDMANRQACAREGHRYQVHGKTSPTKLACTRCRVTWAVGARTEPTP